MDAIRVRGLRKSYGDNDAVRGIDFSVAVGEVVAMLGPNGAGKTTTVEILEGYRSRDAGDVSVLGIDPGATDAGGLRERVGIVLQSGSFDGYLTVAEMVQLHSEYYLRPRAVDEVIALVGLDAKANARVKTLSGGQQRRLDVALGLIGDPELLFLDEPTTGFDPGARRQSWELVRNLAELGKTVLLTTHYMDEAQALADRLLVMSSGRIVADGTPAALVDVDAEPTKIRFRADSEPPPRLGFAREAPGVWALATRDVSGVLYELTHWSRESGVDLLELSVAPPSLEDVYLRLVNAAGADSEPDTVEGGAR